ncbi:MAG: hypothetical protein ABJE95_11005 [Byssovorax sp.]
MLMPSLVRGRPGLVAPLFAALALLTAAPASAQHARGNVAIVARPPADAPPAKPETPALAVAAPEPSAKESPAWDTARATHRSGFVVGLAIGTGVTAFSGYPNDSRKIGLASHYTETGASIGGTFSLWIGGALSDWFTFGIGFTGGNMPLLSDQKAAAGGLIFHVEAYPLFTRGGHLRDLGIFFNAGTGSASVTPKDSDKKLIDSGSASVIGGGPFYEGFKLWKTKGGPFVEGSYIWSDSVRRPGVFFGWRTSLYTGI